MAKEAVLIVGSVFAGIVAILIFLVYMLLLPCDTGPPFEIESKRLLDPPSRFVKLNASQLEQYPLIGNVIKAYDDPNWDSNATLRGDVLHYAVFNETELRRTEYYLWDRSTYDPGTPRLPSDYPTEPVLYFLAYDDNDGSGLQYTLGKLSQLTMNVSDLSCT